MYVAIVTGDREWKNKEVIARALAELPEDALVVHGDCRGADRLAEIEAIWLGLKTKPVPAHWRHKFGCDPDCKKIVGVAAGAIRNRVMLDTYREHLRIVLAFHNDLTESKGTRDMVTIARKAGIPVRLFTESGEVEECEIESLLSAAK